MSRVPVASCHTSSVIFSVTSHASAASGSVSAPVGAPAVRSASNPRSIAASRSNTVGRRPVMLASFASMPAGSSGIPPGGFHAPHARAQPHGRAVPVVLLRKLRTRNTACARSIAIPAAPPYTAGSGLPGTGQWRSAAGSSAFVTELSLVWQARQTVSRWR